MLAWYWNEWSRRAMSLEDHAIMKDAEGGDSEFAQKLRAEDRGQYKAGQAQCGQLDKSHFNTDIIKPR